MNNLDEDLKNISNKILKKISYGIINDIIDHNNLNSKIIKNNIIKVITEEMPDNINIDITKIKQKLKQNQQKIEIVECKNKNWDNYYYYHK